jgi:hypothetical protein
LTVDDGSARLPLLHTRAWPRREVEEGFDEWQRTRHLPELMAAPGVVSAWYYRTVREGLPAAWQGSGTVMVSYVCESLDGLFTFICSPELEAAVADGVTWFDRFNELDGTDYTGNIYEVAAVAEGAAGTVTQEHAVVCERFEAGDAAAELDAWLAGEHLPALAALPQVARARSFTAVRHGSPLPYYYSPGDRMVQVELAVTRPPDALTTPAFLERLADSMRWDRRLTYVRRDAYRYVRHVVAQGTVTSPA